jgi:hypothetical protein
MLQLSNKWAEVLNAQPETGMGYQIATICLKDGRRYDRVVVVQGNITSVDGDGVVPFKESDISRIVVTHDKAALHK